MISSWRRKKAGRAATGVGGRAKGKPAELITPNQFRCPISLDLMKDPVIISTGITYDRESIEKWMEAGNMTCPVTNQVLKTLEPVPNHTLRRMIQDWCVENRSHGVERIPTPRTPISSTQVVKLLEKISMAQDHPLECQQLIEKLTISLNESERNKKCIVANGAARTLSSVFQFYADGEGESVISLLEDVLSALTSILPEFGDQLSNLKTTKSLERLVWFLNRGGLAGRMNAALILKELVSSSKDQKQVYNSLVSMEGGIEGLVRLVKEPISPSSTKATLVIIYNMITSIHYQNLTCETIVGRFVDMGLVPIILDIIVDAEKSVCEKALGVLDGLCRFDAGIKAAHGHSLTVPVVVKKILRVSELATEFSVSVLWRLSQNGEDGVVVEALQVGAFQKLLLVLQVGWNVNERTREKVTKLLKLLNIYREKVECIESADFKDLKRPF